MRKGTRLIKRAVPLFLVLLLCIENFAAIVSDNDGSAFITKAEFDSLKNNFQSQIDQYNTSIDQKIDGAIASYLAGIRLSKTTELTNNLNKLQNSYDVFWCNQTGGVLTQRAKYGSSYEIQIGARGSSLVNTDALAAQAKASVEGTYRKFPIITSNSLGGYDISYWEERKPWISYCGFFLANLNNKDTFFTWEINGIFSTINFNPNTNNIFKRQDQWWNLPGTDEPARADGSWAMSIWGIYSTQAQNRDNKSIFIYPNAGNTYCWNESDIRTSTGSGSLLVPNVNNNGTWAGTAWRAPTAKTGNLALRGYTHQSDTGGAWFPWCDNQYAYKDLYDSRISTITGVRFPINAGLMVSDGEGPGVLKINASGTASGALQVTIKNVDNTSQLKYQEFTVGTSRETFSIDLKSLENKQKFNIWIKYLPSVKSELFIENIVHESENT
jgi:hypothetical protein